MNTINQSILTLILLAPLAGAILVAVLPDRGKLPAWMTLVHNARQLRPDAASAGALRP